nr:MAG TPA: hypothetical protein [Caudoviricetes sp.]
MTAQIHYNTEKGVRGWRKQEQHEPWRGSCCWQAKMWKLTRLHLHIGMDQKQLGLKNVPICADRVLLLTREVFSRQSVVAGESKCERFNRGRRARAEAELYGQSAGCVFELGDSVGRYIFKECNGSRIERLKNTG